MSAISILLTIIAYFAVLYGVSFLTGKQADNSGFFTGGRRQRWYVVAFAMIAANLSGVTFVSVPGMVASSGMGYLQMVMGFIVGQLIIAFVLTPLFYRLSLSSIYQFLENRFGLTSCHTGAWFFFISKMLGASVRFFLVCLTLQILLFDPLGIPFIVNVCINVLLVYLYTYRGGVKSIVWSDCLKTLCVILSVVLCMVFIARSMGLSLSGMMDAINGRKDLSRVFFLDDINHKQFFLKQFLAGIFTMIATNGLDQDMMQRNLSCRNSREAQKNMVISIVLQLVVIWAFLVLGALLYLYAESQGIGATGDRLFPVIATGGYLPAIVGVLFILGLVSSAYSTAGSALTALTTSFTVDIIGVKDKTEERITHIRKRTHVAMAVVMGLVIVVFNLLNNTSVIDAVYTLASYTYGPLLGLFTFGIFCKKEVHDKLVPVVALASPVLCLIIDKNSKAWLNGYSFSYELLIMNALFTIIGLCLLIKRKKA